MMDNEDYLLPTNEEGVLIVPDDNVEIEETEDVNLPDNQKLIPDTATAITDNEANTYFKPTDSMYNHTLGSEQGYTHEVACPEMEFPPLKTEYEMAREYKFKLDGFQKAAINCVENNQSVLVAAHTSSGKTAVALYAIAKSFKAKQRVIYTTPIKALSNQKYRELMDEFGDVGLMTGDVTTSSNANCLVMTTEILRSMIYRGAEVIKQVKWVIFDEIHYMRDPERGIVWEESIALLPSVVRFVFLSATISNAREFAEWICHIHRHPCHVVYTDRRPIPLQKYVFCPGDTGIHLIMNEENVFQQDVYDNVFEKLKLSKGNKTMNQDFKNLIKMIMNKDMAPVIVFTFSRRLCEEYALQISEYTFNDAEESSTVAEIFENAIDTLNEEEKKLPQVKSLLSILKRGIGIHHSGLLPILKETVEVLFAEGLIKALFATETFAMGLNMPARTVLFSDIQKYDGKTSRCLKSGEFIQMSGRAGRRSIDKRGIVIIMLNNKLEKESIKNMFKGEADKLDSAFYLSYTMILNMIRVSQTNVNFLLQRTFYQFQNYKNIPSLMQKIEKLKSEISKYYDPNEHKYESYYRIRANIDFNDEKMRKIICKPENIVPFLQDGRFVRIVNNGVDFGWGVVVNFINQATDASSSDFYVETLVCISKSCSPAMGIKNIRPSESDLDVNFVIIPHVVESISSISSIRMFIPKDLSKKTESIRVYTNYKSILKKFPSGLPLLDPVIDMGIKSSKFAGYVSEVLVLEDKLKQSQIYNNPAYKVGYEKYIEKKRLSKEVGGLEEKLEEKRKVLLIDELKRRKSLLKILDFIDVNEKITEKGRVGCNISAVDPILLTELILNKFFNDMTPNQIAAIVSCFVFQEKSNIPNKISADLQQYFVKIKETATMVANVSKECKIRDFDEKVYLDKIKPEMMNMVLSWTNGAKFSSLCEQTDIFEGTIIRTMRRLEECLRELSLAAKTIEQTALEDKFLAAIKLIKRDIVFAPSLYL